MTNKRHGVRCRSRSFAFRLVASLVAVLLPLQGITGAMASIEAPAHYHLPSPVTGSTSSPDKWSGAAAEASEKLTRLPRGFGQRPSAPASHAHAVDPDNASIARAGRAARGAHLHHSGEHVHDAPSETSEVDGANTRPLPLAASSHAAAKVKLAPRDVLVTSGKGIGHHAHELAESGVVYVKGSPDHPESGAAGAHAAAADAALTGWWVPLRGDIGAQSLPHASWRYRSHPGLPALRPPAAADAPTA